MTHFADADGKRGEVGHQGDLAGHRRKAAQRIPEPLRLKPQPVHSGIELEVDRDPGRKPRPFEHCQLLRVVHHGGERVRGDRLELPGREEALHQENRPLLPRTSQLERRFELDQRQAVRLGKGAHRAREPVTVGVRLHNRPGARARRTSLRHAEVVAKRCGVDSGADRAHGAAIQPQTPDAHRAASLVAAGKAWYKADANPGTGNRMNRSFYTIMAAQFFSSLADNALLIAAIAQLLELDGPAWMVPLLKFFFTVSYVVLAAFVGAFADAIPKGRVMFITNTIKIVGCVMMFFTDYVEFAGIPGYVLVLAAYAVVGFGAAAYSPAKYGILTELLPAERLVAANGWIEGLTVASIILGTVLGGALISPRIASLLLAIDVPHIDTGIETPAEAAIVVISTLFIPDTGARYGKQQTNPALLMRDFYLCLTMLWKDKLGQISLAVTTLFWGAGATLQFLVLQWAAFHLGLPLDKGAILQGVTAIGVALGAVVAGRFISLKRSLDVLPAGVIMGAVVMLMIFVSSMPLVYFLLIVIGMMAGFFVVPMNALLQHRGYVLLSAGHSIAVQNFNENISILLMLAIYSAMIKADFHINTIIVAFGTFVVVAMLGVILRHRYNQRRGDSLHLIGMKTSPQRGYP